MAITGRCTASITKSSTSSICETRKEGNMAELDMSWETKEMTVIPTETEEQDFSDFEI